MVRLARWLLTRPVRPRVPVLRALETLEPRDLPTGMPVAAFGAILGGPPVVRMVDDAGADVRAHDAYAADFTGGVRVAVADLTADGVPEVVAGPGAGGGPHVRVWDGATGDELGGFMAYDPAFRGGVFVAAGPAGLVTGAGDGGGPHVRLFSPGGADRGGFMAYDPAFRGGVRVATGRGPGGREVVYTAAGTGGGPHVRGFDPITGAALLDLMVGDPVDRAGRYVGAEDRSGDGLDELVVEKLGLTEVITPKLVTGQNITQTLQFVESGNAELGFVALSQVIGKPATQVWVAQDEDYSPILQDAVLLKAGEADPAAKAFIAFLKGPEATDIIRKYGYELAQ